MLQTFREQTGKAFSTELYSSLLGQKSKNKTVLIVLFGLFHPT
jgi:hypothetical protein